MSIATPSFLFSVPQGFGQDQPVFALIEWAHDNASDSRYTIVMIEHDPHDAGLREFAKQKSLISLGVVCSTFSLIQGRDMLGELRQALLSVLSAARATLRGEDLSHVGALLTYCGGSVCEDKELLGRRLTELRRALEEPAQRQITGGDDNAAYATLAYVRAMLDVVDDAIARDRQFVHVRM